MVTLSYVFGREKFRRLIETPLKPIAWGIVCRYMDPAQRPASYGSDLPSAEDTSLLVVERYKRSDPDRQGKLVVPGGGIKKRDGSIREAAQRETSEEATLDTSEAPLWSLGDHFERPIAFEKEDLTGLYIPRPSDNPLIVVAYST